MKTEREKILNLQRQKIAELERDLIRSREVLRGLIDDTFKNPQKVIEKLTRTINNSGEANCSRILQERAYIFEFGISKEGKRNAVLVGKRIEQLGDIEKTLDIEIKTLAGLEAEKKKRETQDAPRSLQDIMKEASQNISLQNLQGYKKREPEPDRER